MRRKLAFVLKDKKIFFSDVFVLEGLL